MRITLYTGPQCELCEQALALILQIEEPVDLKKVSVRDTVELYHLYGARIPVIKKNSAIEQGSVADLGWPFTLTQLREFLA
jgi:hypothetical protein